MRTKALLLTAAMGAAGIASSFGQGTVYSVNAVGFINLTVPAGPSYSIIANQLNGTNNNVNTVMPVVPNGTQLYKWDAAAQSLLPAVEYATGFGWYMTDDEGNTLPSDATLAPGEAAFMLNLGGSFTVTLVGEVPQGPALTVPVAGSGYSLISSMVPQSAGLASMGFPGQNGMQYQAWDAATQGFKPSIEFATGFGWYYTDDEGNTIATDPTPGIGEGFFILNLGASVSWTRNFSVNN